MNALKSLWFSFLATISFMLIKLSSFFKVSFIIGSSKALFSGTSIVVPLVGYYGGFLGGGLLLGMGAVWRCLSGDFYSLHYLAYHIPGFCAGLYWALKPCSFSSRALGLLLPALCMALFVTHPVGNQAWVYTMYWFIPMALICFNYQSLFSNALISTFIAHAVGSTIWIYTMPMTAAAWYALLPIVAVERLFFALGMILSIYALNWIKNGMTEMKLQHLDWRHKKMVHNK